MTQTNLGLMKQIAQILTKVGGYAPMMICAALLLTGCGKERSSDSMEALSEVAQNDDGEEFVRNFGNARKHESNVKAEKTFLDAITFKGYIGSNARFEWKNTGQKKPYLLSIYLKGKLLAQGYPSDIYALNLALDKRTIHKVTFIIDNGFGSNRTVETKLKK